jgi:PIN domain nuclease of toxin-antitoxin system
MIVLDTHAWFWWLAESPKISRRAILVPTDAGKVALGVGKNSDSG